METTGIRLFPFIAFPTLLFLCGISLLIIGLPKISVMANWIDGGNQYVLPYIIATLLSISYPIGIIINYFLQLVLKVKNYFLHKLVDRNTKDSSISLQNYVKILCRDSSGVIIKELEVKYGFLVFWRLCAFAMFLLLLILSNAFRQSDWRLWWSFSEPHSSDHIILHIHARKETAR